MPALKASVEETGRKAFLMELDGPYCDLIVERWEKRTMRKAIRPARQEALAIAAE